MPGSRAELAGANVSTARNFCAGSTSPECRFIDAPVQLGSTPTHLDGRALTFYPMSRKLTFVDGLNQAWIAPAGTLTDGASIPKVFINIVGSPTSPSFVNAAAIHDAICGIGNEQGEYYHTRTWQSTHRMFYDALRVGGTEEITAKVMFAAVYLGGPRWGVKGYRSDPRIANIPDIEMEAAMRQAKAYIEKDNPSIPKIERYLDRKLRMMFTRLDGGRDAMDNEGPIYVAE
ncbi:DUF1353 domain-containing protein [Pseudooceanicola nanhaiensis]|uniref:DUF1353 domain-containing protein n=1 Tax=Pseudooceanicola nanhaiensis TaxID=375761 RepID=UPI001CD7C561|nr:DUF1353 domain-containing protein [Pseudooceanicola nanhaiensis]MCA0922284.1 DUF1353 domain-containing protein [Pseudooceanicola nanhaiensis]